MQKPDVHFATWKKWAIRENPNDEFDVPVNFGLMGIYLLASPEPSSNLCYYTQPNVVYIGMSTNTTGRLYKHSIIGKYKNEFADPMADNLYFTQWQSDWSNFYKNTKDTIYQKAFLHYIERKLIWEYVKIHGRLPKLNRM